MNAAKPWYEALGSVWLLRKLLTRPLRWWELRRAVPEREAIFALKPFLVPKEGAAELLVLLTPDFVFEAAWCARSILFNLKKPPCLTLVCDGVWPSTTRDKVEGIFPGCAAYTTSELLGDIKGPKLKELASRHPLGRKLALILSRQAQRHVVYSDADVFAFNPLNEVSEFLSEPGEPLYIQELKELNTDPLLLAKLSELNLPYAKTINTGFLCVPKGSFNPALAEQVLDVGELDNLSWFCETTLLAALMEAAGGKTLPRERYVVSTQRQFFFESDVDYDQLALRHFVTPVRHLIGLFALPILVKRLA